MSFFTGYLFGLFGCVIAVPLLLVCCRVVGLYTTIHEGHCKVFTLFGKVIGVLAEPGLAFPCAKFGPKAFLLPFFGKQYNVDIRLDQVYLRSQPVNSEEGTPMGIGVWYEMYVTNPVDFLFKNTDPDGSLRANVSNATVRSLSNMPLDDMLQNRHVMSKVVRGEVSPKSQEWGYQLGSVYIRKVHFRDATMIRQIEEKVSNRLRQVTSAIRQAGANQVEVIKSAAEKEASSEFARAETMRPQYVGSVMDEIARDPDLLDAILEILQIDRIVKSGSKLTLIPSGRNASVMTDLLATQGTPGEFSKTAQAPPATELTNATGFSSAPDVPPLPKNQVSPGSSVELFQSMAERFGQGERMEKVRSVLGEYQKFAREHFHQ
jgi:regulator of protease activity HflC (stomatin/prohibitin superfamily)